MSEMTNTQLLWLLVQKYEVENISIDVDLSSEILKTPPKEIELMVNFVRKSYSEKKPCAACSGKE